MQLKSLILAILLVPLFWSSDQADPSPKLLAESGHEISWLRDIEEAEQQAAREQKPLLTVFR